MRFLFDNPFILIILIGAISSLFQRAKAANPENKKGYNPIPRRNPASPVGPDRPKKPEMQQQIETKTSRPYRQQNANRKPIPTQKEIYHQLENVYEATQKNAKENKQVFFEDHRVSKQAGTHQKEEVPKAKSQEIDRDNLIEGLIWSEVLGPPRAKRPHRSVK